ASQRIGFWIDVSAGREPAAIDSPRPVPLPARLFTAASGELSALVHDFGNTLPALFFIYDLAEHRHLLVNRAFQEVLGYQFEHIEALGPAFLPKVMHPDDLRRALEQRHRYDSLGEGEVIESEDRLMSARGEHRWVSSRQVVISRDAQGRARQILGIS